MDGKGTFLLESTFRKFTIEKLEAVRAISSYPEDLVSTTTISGTLMREGRELGGTLSSLSRTKVDEKPLIISAGRSDEGLLWKINEEVAPKINIRKLAEQILEENKSYRMARNKSET